MNLRRDILLWILLGILTAQGCNDKPGAGSPSDPSRAADVSAATALNSPAKPSPEQLEKWKIPQHEQLQLLACYDGFDEPAVLCVALSPDRTQFVLGGTKLTLWNVNDSHPARELLARSQTGEGENPIRCVVFSADGKSIAAGDQKGTVRILPLGGEREAKVLQAHDGHVSQLAFSPDSQLLATTSYSGEVTLWQLPEGKRLKNLKTSDQEISRLEFLSNQLLAAAGGETCIWNVDSGQKEAALNKKHVIGPTLALSADRQVLAFSDPDSAIQLWDVQGSKLADKTFHGAAAHLIAFSPDGKRIATYSQDSTIRIWDLTTGSVVQVIDTDGGPTSGLAWLSDAALLVASVTGRVSIWGTASSPAALGIEPIELPKPPTPSGNHRSLSSAQLQKVIDIRSFPRMPGAVPQWNNFQMCGYVVHASPADAAVFYRYFLEKGGWKVAEGLVVQPGLAFHKDDCELTASFTPAAESSGGDGDLQVSLHFAGNYDARWLPKVFPTNSKSSWDLFSSISYRTKADLTDVEVTLLKQFHDAGWTAYTRLDASSSEEPDSRHISMLQGGSELTIFIGHPADSRQELAVQTSISVTNKSLPIPPDSGWIEFDNSTDLKLVANSKMDLEKTVQFFDTQMAAEGWLARDAGRHIREGKAWLPYIRGQEQVQLRLLPLADGGTRIVVGDAAASSWQLKAPDIGKAEKTEKPGIQAANFTLPAGATAVKYDVDEKRIDFELPGVAPTKLGEQFIAQMEALHWKREGAGIISDDYTFITYSKDKQEIQVRARGDAQKASAMVSGDGLLWDQPLPGPPTRVSYGTWLRRGHKTATLDLLEEFAAEMHKIPTNETGK
jgi:WD40 repeat protein